MQFVPSLLLLLVSVMPTTAGTKGWDAALADGFSPRPDAIRSEIADLDRQLAALPAIPVEDQGGTGGYYSNCYAADVTPRRTIELRWPAPARIDLVALVPARNYDADGLDIQYGLPDRFAVDLLGADGQVVRHLADEQDTGSRPLRAGYPFVYQLYQPLEAGGLRITASRIARVRFPTNAYVHAWGELFAFAGERNVAQGAKITTTPDQGLVLRHWRWQPGFIVDGQTPLGLPEFPTAEEVKAIGWTSKARSTADEEVWVQLDLGVTKTFDGVTLFPTLRPSLDRCPGLGLPQTLRLAVSATGEPEDFKVFAGDPTGIQVVNPGQNPVTVRFPPQQGRFVRIIATKLWKEFANYPAFFALSEVQILNHETNLAAGAAVTSSDSIGRQYTYGGKYWGEASLTDGFGPQGRLVPRREWLLGLQRRIELETRRHELGLELDGIVKFWRQLGIGSLVTMGGLSVLGLFILPIRYRIREKRQLRTIRERIASDLHDEVGSNLATIALLAELPPTPDNLDDINRLSRETSLSLREILDITLAAKRARKPLVERLRDIASLMLRDHEWTFESTEAPVFHPEQRKNLVFFFKEAIHNIIRHATARHVHITFEQTPPDFRLAIEDDGVGIPSASPAAPDILHTLHQRAKNLQGALQVESQPGAGTRLILTFPIEPKNDE